MAVVGVALSHKGRGRSDEYHEEEKFGRNTANADQVR